MRSNLARMDEVHAITRKNTKSWEDVLATLRKCTQIAEDMARPKAR
jgi:hypothetical protein